MSNNFSKTSGIAGAILKKILPPVAGGAGTALGMDYIASGGDYSHVDKERVGRGVFNALLGGLGGHYLGKGDLAKGLTPIALAPTKDVAFAAIPAVKAFERNQNKSFLEKLSPTEKGLLLGGGAVAAATLIPAMIQINRAAKRMAEGRSIRISTSLRKRPNQNQDLTIGVRDIDENEPVQESNQSHEVPPQFLSIPQSKPKGFLSGLFGA